MRTGVLPGALHPPADDARAGDTVEEADQSRVEAFGEACGEAAVSSKPQECDVQEEAIAASDRGGSW
jgi:hypothetical protein